MSAAYGLSVVDKNPYATWSVAITKTTFSFNSQAASLSIRAINTFEVAEIIISNNMAKPDSKVAGLVFIIGTNSSNVSLSGQCLKAIGSLLWWSIITNRVLFLLSDSRFVNVETNSVEYAVKFVPVAAAVTVLTMSTQQTTQAVVLVKWC